MGCLTGLHQVHPALPVPSAAAQFASRHSLLTMQAHNAPTTTMAVDASGALVATGCSAHEIRVWDVPGGFCTHSFSGHNGLVLRVIFHSRELLLASAGDDGTVVIWDLVTKKKKCGLRGHVSAVTALAWSQDEWHLLSASRDKTVVVWDVRTNERMRTIAIFDSIEAMTMLPPGAPVPGVSGNMDPSKAMFFATGGEGGDLKVWDGHTGRCVHTHKRAGGSALARDIVAVLPSASAHGLLVATADCQLSQYRLATDGCVLERNLLGNADQVTAVRFLGAPTAPAAAQQAQQASVGAPQPAADALAAPPPSLPPQFVLATNSDLIHVMSTTNVGCERTLAGHKATVLALAVLHVPEHDCWLLASAGKDKALRVWHLASGTCLAVGSGHLAAINSVTFAAKAAPFVVTGGSDKLVRVYDLAPVWDTLPSFTPGAQPPAKRKPLKLAVTATVAAHEKDVNSVAVAPNNKLAASGGADRLAKLWQLPALAAPMTLRGHKRGVMDICFAPIDRVRLCLLCLHLSCKDLRVAAMHTVVRCLLSCNAS